MGQELPSGWVKAKLVDVAELLFGQSPPSSTYNQEGNGLPFFQGKAEFGATYPTVRVWCTEPTRVVEKDDILISIRAPVGPTNLAPYHCAIGRGLAAVRPKIERDFVRFYLKYIENELAGKGTGTTFAAITKDILQNQLVVLAPLNEQRRIVSKIEELFSRLDDGEAALRRVQRLLTSYRQAVLKAAVTGELTKEWREANQHRLESATDLLQRILRERRTQWQGRGQYQEPQQPDTRGLPELPIGWVWVSVDQLLRETLMNGHSVRDAINGFPVLRLTALKNGRIDLSEQKVGAWTEKEALPYLVTAGDFFVSRGNGSRNLVGRGGQVNDESKPVAFPDTLIRIRISSDGCHQGYFNLIWNSYFMRSQIEASARTTAGIYKINQQDICSFVLPLASLEEQKEMADRLEDVFSRIDALEAWCNTELTRSTTLRQSILKAAFSGQLVEQDPSDEPASELLQRIHAARQTPSSTEAKGTRPPKQATLWEPS